MYYEYEFNITLPRGLAGRRRAMKYSKMFGGRVYESAYGGYLVNFEVKTEAECKAVGKIIDKMEMRTDIKH